MSDNLVYAVYTRSLGRDLETTEVFDDIIPARECLLYRQENCQDGFEVFPYVEPIIVKSNFTPEGAEES